MNEMTRNINVPNDWDRSGLPGWCYHSDALLELEKQHVFREHWQIACHVSDVPEPGNYITMDVVGERALILRDQDGTVRGFHNICRHRGSRVVADEKGTCRNALVCPFHGWVYNLDGTLRGAARPRSFPPLNKQEFGLIALDIEVWMGFVLHPFCTRAPAVRRRTDAALRGRTQRIQDAGHGCRRQSLDADLASQLEIRSRCR